jgi:DNA polymerase III delta prime subunit
MGMLALVRRLMTLFGSTSTDQPKILIPSTDLNMTTPSKFIPAAASDFVGHGDFGAATAARSLEALVAQSRQNKNASMAILFNGRPGIGKSALSRWFLYDVLGCSKFSITRLNGTQVNLDRVEDIAAGLPYRDLYADYKAVWFEECDLMTKAAQGGMLTLLDDLNETPGNVILCTSNCALKDFEPRFSSRFTVFELQPPSSDEIETLLRRWLTTEGAIKQIAQFACGNVRTAIKDADLQFAAEQS